MSVQRYGTEGDWVAYEDYALMEGMLRKAMAILYEDGWELSDAKDGYFLRKKGPTPLDAGPEGQEG